VKGAEARPDPTGTTRARQKIPIARRASGLEQAHSMLTHQTRTGASLSECPLPRLGCAKRTGSFRPDPVGRLCAHAGHDAPGHARSEADIPPENC
jgi:hypothetical protein